MSYTINVQVQKKRVLHGQNTARGTRFSRFFVVPDFGAKGLGIPGT